MKRAELADVFGKKILSVTQLDACHCAFQLEEFITVMFWLGDDGCLHLSAIQGPPGEPTWYTKPGYELW